MTDFHEIWYTYFEHHSKENVQMFVGFSPAVTIQMTFTLGIYISETIWLLLANQQQLDNVTLPLTLLG